MGKTQKNKQHEFKNGEAKDMKRTKKTQPYASISPLNVSSIEKASFLEDDEIVSYGNPLHSTALEEDLSPNLGQNGERPQALVRGTGAKSPSNKGQILSTRRPGHAAKGLTPPRTRVRPPSKSSAKKGNQPHTQERSLGARSRTRPLQRVSEGLEVEETAGKRRATSVKSRAPVSEEQSTDTLDSDSAGLGAQGPAPKQPQVTLGAKEMTKKGAVPKNRLPPHSEGSTPSFSQEAGPSQNTASEGGDGSWERPVPVRRRRLSTLSSEELSEEDPSWRAEQGKQTFGSKHMGKKQKSTSRSLGDPQKDVAQKRKSSSSSSGSAGPSKENKHQQRNVKNPIDLDVVLDTFQDFVSQYKETVESASVRQAIDALSDTFEDQLIELITNTKELNGLKKENIKVNGAINRKRSRLVEVKNELIQKEMQLKKLQKEHSQLEERLSDLRRGSTFLSDLKDLHKNYLTHRQRHPNEVEVYGPSSLPALLLEARAVLGAENQLKNINEKLQQVLDQAAHHELLH